MFEDLRFYFPEERILERLKLFSILDIFSNEHLHIKQTYRRYVASQRQKQIKEQLSD